LYVFLLFFSIAGLFGTAIMAIHSQADRPGIVVALLTVQADRLSMTRNALLAGPEITIIGMTPGARALALHTTSMKRLRQHRPPGVIHFYLGQFQVLPVGCM
ncbi:MAG: hypothetical protein ACO1N5_15410, partial [Noviherbaspirillum sp.]